MVAISGVSEQPWRHPGPARKPLTWSRPTLELEPFGLAPREDTEHDQADRDQQEQPGPQGRGGQCAQRRVDALGLPRLGLDRGYDEEDARRHEHRAAGDAAELAEPLHDLAA